jgi:sugar phosphate isomerase/epimerase
MERRAMRIGIDSYSYHRLLGEVRAGEQAVPGTLDGVEALVAEMVDAGAEVLSLETVFLDAPDRLDVAALLAAAGGCEIALAWGHPLGIAWGADAGALDELLAWIELAPALGTKIVRCVAAGPALQAVPKGPRLEATARALRRAVALARARRVTLALENHADVDGDELLALLEAVPGLAVCLDTANALRVGDDPVDVARRLARHVAMVHLKDVEDQAGADPLTGPASVAYDRGVVDLDGVLDALLMDGMRRVEGCVHLDVAGAADPSLPVCVELGHLGGGAVDERALVRQGVGWLVRARRARAGGH